MIQNTIFRNVLTSQRLLLLRKSSTLNIEKLETESQQDLEVSSEDVAAKEAEIERKRNKSMLNESDRNTLFEKPRYNEQIQWFHNTLKYNRKLYGKYGNSSGVNPSICWPTKQELSDRLEYERIAHPFTIPEMIQSNEQKRKEKIEDVTKRQREIVEKMGKLDGWIKEVENKIAKKESEAREARARKERLIEEVKAHFGFTVDPKDDRFKELLEKKEKEQKKAMKEARKKANEQKLMEKLIKKTH